MRSSPFAHRLQSASTAAGLCVSARAFAAGLFIGVLSNCFAAPVCDPVTTFADGKVPNREIFVSPDGDNTTGKGTESSPYATINRALQSVRPGDAIRLLPGMYQGGEFVQNIAGTQDAPIWLGGVPGKPRPVFKGGSQAIHFSRVRYVVVENLEISGARGNGLNCDDAGDCANANATHHVLFRNLHIREIGAGGNQDGLKLSGLNDFFVLDCEFARISAGGSGIDHVGCHRGIIARCAFTDMGSNSIQCKGGSEDIEIRGNRFLNGGSRAINLGGSTGFQFFRPPLSKDQPNAEARNIRVISNVFRGADAPIAFVGAVDSLVANNTIVEPGHWIFRILQETVSRDGYAFAPCGGNRFINNLIVFNGAQIRSAANVGSNTDPASFEFGHNLWYRADNPRRSRPELPAPESNGLYGIDPNLDDRAGGDFSLSNGSPALGKGRQLKEVQADFRGHYFANPPSIGAFESDLP